MEAGNTFKYGQHGHLWVVVSNPTASPARVLIVNMTTDRGIDRSCILNVGDHPFVEHPTCMRYDMARIETNQDLERHVASDTIQLHQPVSADILERIRLGAATTDHIPLKCKQLLIDQGLIEP